MATTDEMGEILAAIRAVESGGDYTARNPGSSASGAYQFTDPTWKGVGGGRYAAHAWMATPEQQDEIAAGYVQQILDVSHNVGAVPRIWYVGDTTHPDSYLPPGNKLTVGQYVEKFFKALNDASDGRWKLPGTGWKIPGTQNVPSPGDAVDAGADALAGALNAAVDPLVRGLARIGLIGLAVTGGVALMVAGAWRTVGSS